MNAPDGIHKQFEGDVQYPYADVGGLELLHISKVNHDNRRDYKYTCPYCKKTLRPRLCKGSRRSHYFHNPGECCDPDRYIHATAERLLKEKWDRDEPFEITMIVRTVCSHQSDCLFGKNHNQCFFQETKTYDLKKHYSQCLVEKKYGNFIPDLCLIDKTGKHDPIFIEIWSKHKNSEKKAESEHMIIEIRLKSISDLEALSRNSITESETVTFSHFKSLIKAPVRTDGPELMKYSLFADSLKSHVDTKYVTCSNFNTKHRPKAVLEIVGMKNDFYSISSFWKYCNAIAIDKGYDIRSCPLCRKYGEDKSTITFDPVIGMMTDPDRGCRRDFKNQGLIPCKPDDAKTCEHFTLKDYPLKRIIEGYSRATLYIWEKHPDGTETEEYKEGKSIEPEPKTDFFNNSSYYIV